MRYQVRISRRPTNVHSQVAAVAPTQRRQCPNESGQPSLCVGIVFPIRCQYAYAPHALALLRARRERPSRRAAEHSDEFAPSNAHLPSRAGEPIEAE
jgi:hypothetical protein